MSHWCKLSVCMTPVLRADVRTAEELALQHRPRQALRRLKASLLHLRRPRLPARPVVELQSRPSRPAPAWYLSVYPLHRLPFGHPRLSFRSTTYPLRQLRSAPLTSPPLRRSGPVPPLRLRPLYLLSPLCRLRLKPLHRIPLAPLLASPTMVSQLHPSLMADTYLPPAYLPTTPRKLQLPSLRCLWWNIPRLSLSQPLRRLPRTSISLMRLSLLPRPRLRLKLKLKQLPKLANV